MPVCPDGVEGGNAVSMDWRTGEGWRTILLLMLRREAAAQWGDRRRDGATLNAGCGGSCSNITDSLRRQGERCSGDSSTTAGRQRHGGGPKGRDAGNGFRRP